MATQTTVVEKYYDRAQRSLEETKKAMGKLTGFFSTDYRDIVVLENSFVELEETMANLMVCHFGPRDAW